ncbi:MAG TPA: hypothetical protein VFF73_19485 [Planctomycetota bacterium]|nr:hypothetical protein [Planctomycetota bacterium]
MADLFATDEKLIEQAAQKKQSEANAIIVQCAIMGLIVGALVGVLVHSAKLELAKSVSETVLIGVPGGLGLVIGISQGLARAFWRRVEAAQFRMLLELERRTRPVK